MKNNKSKSILSILVFLSFSSAALAQVVQEINGTVTQIEQGEKEAMISVDGRQQILMIRNLTKFTAGELSLLKSSLEQSLPIKLKTQGNEIIAISKQ